MTESKSSEKLEEDFEIAVEEQRVFCIWCLASAGGVWKRGRVVFIRNGSARVCGGVPFVEQLLFTRW